MNWCASSTRGGTAAARDAARTANTTTATIVTAAHRGSFRRTSHDTAGSAPNAKNKATPINTSTDDARHRMRTAPYVTATPAEAVNPKENGDRRLNRGPRTPRGCWLERI